nr:mitogen-activated protein kinase kinase kinase NPK1-like [Ipomoea batatas]
MTAWEKQRFLGSGSYGQVHLAVLKPAGEMKMAVKSAAIQCSCSLQREGAFLDALRDCPFIVRCFGEDVSMEHGKHVYNLLLEYAPGGQASGSSTYPSVLDMAVHSAEEDGWEVYGHHKAWNNGGSRRPGVMSTVQILEDLQVETSSRVASNPSSEDRLRKIENDQTHPATVDIVTVKNEEQEDDEDEDLLDDSDEEFLSDDFDSDESEKSHETAKKNSWFKEFFDSIDSLSNEELNDPEKQWHYFACKGDLEEELRRRAGMGNQELLDYFSEYADVRARHSYGLQGKSKLKYEIRSHLEMVILIAVYLNRTLHQLIKNTGGIPEDLARLYTYQLLKGIHYMHTLGIIHCDLKPQNVLVFPGKFHGWKRLKLCDFGLAKFSDETNVYGDSHCGTIQYAAPECLTGRSYTAAKDIWAVGCMFVEMIESRRWTAEKLLSHPFLERLGVVFESKKEEEGFVNPLGAWRWSSSRDLFTVLPEKEKEKEVFDLNVAFKEEREEEVFDLNVVFEEEVFDLNMFFKEEWKREEEERCFPGCLVHWS